MIQRPTLALILAAGCGSRLQPSEGHKLFTSVAGRPMIEWHLMNLARIGVNEVVVVTGYDATTLTSTLSQWLFNDYSIVIRDVFNPDWQQSNGSSILAAAHLFSHAWVLMSDHLFSTSYISTILSLTDTSSSHTQNALFVDSARDNVFDVPDVNKIQFHSNGHLKAIGKNIATHINDFDVSDTGLFIIDTTFTDALLRTRQQTGDCNTSDAVRELAAGGHITFPDVAGAMWQDIDTPESHTHVERLIADGRFKVGLPDID